MKIFTLLILLLLLPVTALAQETNVPYIYYTWDNDTQTCIPNNGTAQTAMVVTDQTAWRDGWYVVNSNITINSRVTVIGHVHLILADGCKLTASNGIQVSEGNSLTIYAQSEGDDMGVLEATGNNDAGIGGSLSNANSGTVTIHGGTVNATSGSSAGIGGGGGDNISGVSGGTVTIYGGEVNATSNSGAGIGGGGGRVISGDSGGTVTIYGGEVTAKSIIGAGIGGGGGGDNISGVSGGKVTIHGGTVNATSNSGAGIGGGGGRVISGDSGGTVTIHGGTVNATSGSGAGIGGGRGDHIYGGFGSFSTGTNGNAFIIASSIQDNSEEKKESWSGVIFEGDAGAVYGSPTLQTDATIPAGKTLTVGEDKTLTIGKGVTLTNEGTLTNNGKIVNYGTIDGTGTVPGNILTGLTEDMIAVADATYTYTGVEVTPVVTVGKEDVIYREDTDYTVSYSDNINAGTAKVTVTPIDGSLLLGSAVTKEFTIEKATPTITLTVPTGDDLVYDGKAKEATATVNGVANETEVLTATVTYYSDDTYQTEVEETKDAGTYYVKATFAETNNYKEAESKAEFTITQASATLSFAKETVSATIGETVENTLTVTPEGVTVSYSSSEETVATVDASTGAITLVGAGETTITATINDPNYTGDPASYTLTVTEPYVPEPEPEPEPEPDPISYYNIYVEDVCEGVDITTSKNVVREGGSISLYVEKDTANYTFDNFQVYYKRSYYGPWEVLEEGVQPGEYPIRNIWTHIYIKAEGAEEKEEDPTGIESIEGVKVYTKDGSLYVQTPQREQVIIVSMSGAVVKNEEQIGLKQYHGLQPGIYIVRVGDKAYKLRLN